jgi:pyruvate,water dikinase
MNAVALADASDRRRFGGKALGLSRLARAGLPVPSGIALDIELVEAVVSGNPAALSQLHASVRALTRPLAVRSSAPAEDAEAASFAGQHQPVLGVVSDAALVDAVRSVHASASSAGATGYRAHSGIDAAAQMAVVVQSLVHSEVAGVLFTRDPVRGDDVRVVEAAWGLGEAVVSGLVTPDQFVFERGGRLVRRTAGEKDLALRWRGTSVKEEPVDALTASSFCLDASQLAKLDDLATRVEAFTAGGQDLEFAFAGGALYLLQLRPMTGAAKRAL